MKHAKLLVVMVACAAGCGAQAQEPAEEGSGDYVASASAGEAGEWIVSMQELTVVEREALFEHDMLYVDYAAAILEEDSAQVPTLEGFAIWLDERGMVDPLVVLSKLQQSQVVSENEISSKQQAFNFSSGFNTCSSWAQQGILGARFYTGTNYTGSMFCTTGEGHLDPSIQVGPAYEDLWSLKTYNGSVATVYGSHQHDAYVPPNTLVPVTPWQYQYDDLLHPDPS